MTTVVAREEAPAVPKKSVVDRVYAAVPLASVFVWLCILYAWQARNHISPWDFGDELQMSQISRAIADTGHGARRGQPYGFHTLYTFLTAPAWWIGSTSKAYAAVKYIGVFTMTAAVFPAYFLTRLIASPRASLFAAAATGAAPALVYSSMILPESLAYTWSTLCLFLIAKGLGTRSPRWLTAAAAASLIAPFVRSQLAVMPAVYLLAALALLWFGEPARRWRAKWSARDRVGAVLLGVGAIIFANAVISSRSHEWLIATGYYRGRIIDYGLWAAGALTIGLGILPVVAGLSALFRPRVEQRTRELTAFAAVAAAAVLCFGLYAAVKAAYVSTQFATLIEERNLIYVAPVLFAATALWLDRPRILLVPLAAAAGFACYVVLTTPYALDNVPYAEAYGLSIVQLANRDLSFAISGVEWLLVGTLLVSVLLLIAPRLLERRRHAVVPALALTAALVLAWNLTGEIAGSNASNAFSRQVLRNFPQPRDWLDQATHGHGAVYIGQGIDQGQAFGINMIEFWNPSLKGVWSLDGTAPGPGPTLTPNLAESDGRLFPDPGVDYVVADQGINLVGKLVGPPYGRWRIYRIARPLRTAQSVTGLYADGWSRGSAAYNQYATPGGRSGFIVVSVSRTAWNGPDRPGRVTIKLGPLVISPQHEPALGSVTAIRRWVVHSNTQRSFSIPTPRPPVRVEVTVSPTFSPHDFGLSDARQLGAQLSFRFSPRQPG